MTENEATREMTFEEEYQILQKEKEELFAMENCDSEPPFANSVVRRASRCIRKLLEEIQQYRAIGTVEQINRALDLGSEVHIKLKKYQKIGTVEECRTAVERMKPKKVTYQGEHEKCPSCGSFHVFGKHCTECGQAVDYD